MHCIVKLVCGTLVEALPITALFGLQLWTLTHTLSVPPWVPHVSGTAMQA